jgi:hypothetical protein
VASRCAPARMGTESGSVYGQKGTMKDVFARCLKKIDFQVCTLLNIYVFVHNEISALLLHGLPVTNKRCLFAMCECVCTITDVYFHRLKINHESHEFILDPGTVANK